MDVVPSSKLQVYVGVPVQFVVCALDEKEIALPRVPVLGALAVHVNEHVGAAVTVRLFVVLFCPALLLTVRRTLYVPPLAYVCVGCCCVESVVPLASKSHDQDVGLPVLVSVNRMTSPTLGTDGCHEKLGVGAEEGP